LKIAPFTALSVPLSAAIEVGDTVYCSGQISLRDGRIAGDTIEEQTNIIFDAIEEVLGQFGLDLSNVIKSTVWLTEHRFSAPFNAVYSERLTAPYPTRSTVVSGLVVPGALVEIEVLASKVARRA
jgi:2-iminobutanoate/2-iminopropanoate deaminase